MRRVEILVAAGLAISLTGCVLGGKQTQKAATVTPPTPAPVAKPPAGPPPQPLSIPQTQAQLPAPQPISPEALATTQPPPEPPVEAPPAQRPPRRPAAPAAAQTRPEAPPVPAQTAPAPTPTDERAPVQEILPAGELKRLQESAEGRRQEVNKMLDQNQERTLNRDQRAIVPRIRTFLQQSEDAQRRGDMRLADGLAQRAQALARELPNGNR